MFPTGRRSNDDVPQRIPAAISNKKQDIVVGVELRDPSTAELTFNEDSPLTFKQKNVKNINEIPIKRKSKVRIFMKNPRGLSPLEPYVKTVDIIDGIKMMNAEMAVLCETNIKTHKDYVLNNINSLLDSALRKGTSVHASSTELDPSIGSVQYGGTMIITRTSLTPRIIDHHEDDLGQFNVVTLQGKRGKRLHIFAVYQPFRNTSGENSALVVQRTMLTSQELKNPDPRVLIHETLLER